MSSDNNNNRPPSRIRKRINFSRTYGLRPRTEIRRPSYECEFDEKDVVIERKPTRSRGRSNLMTKYRRKTANERERHRMKEINDAFTTLRGILPAVYTKRTSQVSMTKIRILKLAASYIEALSDLLTEDKIALDDNTIERGPSHFNSCTSCSVTSATLEAQTKPSVFHVSLSKENSLDIENSQLADCLTDCKNSKLKQQTEESLQMTVSPCECDMFSFLGDVAIESSVTKWEIDDLCLSLT